MTGIHAGPHEGQLGHHNSAGDTKASLLDVEQNLRKGSRPGRVRSGYSHSQRPACGP